MQSKFSLGFKQVLLPVLEPVLERFHRRYRPKREIFSWVFSPGKPRLAIYTRPP